MGEILCIKGKQPPRLVSKVVCGSNNYYILAHHIPHGCGGLLHVVGLVDQVLAKGPVLVRCMDVVHSPSEVELDFVQIVASRDTSSILPCSIQASQVLVTF